MRGLFEDDVQCVDSVQNPLPSLHAENPQMDVRNSLANSIGFT